MSNRKFKKGDNILVIKGRHKGMRGTISGSIWYTPRLRYWVTFEHFSVPLYSYQMRLDVVEDESAAIKRMVESIGNREESIGNREESKLKPGLNPGAPVMLSKQGLAKIYISGIISTSHSYEWVRDNNFHKIDRVDTFEGINFYTLIGFNTYHFTEEDLLPVRYGIGEKVRFTRETLVKLGAELVGDHPKVEQFARKLVGPRKILNVVTNQDGKILYQLDGECLGKFFYEHEIESAND